MKSYLLAVIGSVSAEEYLPVRQVMLNKGMKPRVVRMSDERLEQFITAVLGFEDSLREMWSEDQSYEMHNLIRGISRQVVGFNITQGVDSVVYSAEAWDRCERVVVQPYGLTMVKFISYISASAQYVVRESKPQYVEL